MVVLVVFVEIVDELAAAMVTLVETSVSAMRDFGHPGRERRGRGGQFTDLPGSSHAQLDVSGVLLQRRSVGDGVPCGSSSSWCMSSGPGARGLVLHGCGRAPTAKRASLMIAMAALADPLLSEL